ncbi:unnamed protein product, partial [Thlaspi arvense]
MPEVYDINVEAGMSSLAIVNTNLHKHIPNEAPIVSSYNDRIRPLLDTVDRLRNLNEHIAEAICTATEAIAGKILITITDTVLSINQLQDNFLD